MSSNPVEVLMPFLSPCAIDVIQEWIILSCVILTDIANDFQIWMTLAGYEELAGKFAPIRNVE